MGKLTVNELRASAKVKAGAAKAAIRECDVTFHLGEYELLRKHMDAASDLLKQAASACPPGSAEKFVAPEELRRIGG